ncbi:MAG: ECF-type sigma factor [Planctomycetota bacterium]
MLLPPMTKAEEPAAEGDVTRCLRALAQGEADAEGRLLEMLYAELRRLAAREMRGERRDHTLEPTALVHEMWAKLFAQEPPLFDTRGHFLRVAARAMRRVLIDHARAKRSQKRDGHRVRLSLLDDSLVAADERSLDLLALEEALERLDAVDPELARLVELRFFAGLTIEATSKVLGRSTASLERDWRVARALLLDVLTEGDS